MATQKHLHELLKQEQEPFHLKNYISDRRCQLKRSNINPVLKPTTIQVKKRNPIIETSPSPLSKRNPCKHACFFSFHASPDVTRSPFPSFLSAARSPRNGVANDAVLLHIPAKTSALLIEAALRVQRKQSSLNSKPKAQISHIRNLGFGLFSSILKRLKDRSRRSTKTGIRYGEAKSSRPSDVALFGSDSNGRLSSAGWSESNEGNRCLDMETSTSGFRSENYSEEIDFVAEESENGDLNFCEKIFWSSPHNPFKFSLQKSPASGGYSPIFASPTASPRRRVEQADENFEVKSSENFGIEEEEEEDDEKEQASPVSVLDPPFENEDDEHESLDDEDYDVECSFAMVQRAKEQLLFKIHRFERLAELDPIELEKRMMDEDEDDMEPRYDDEETCNHDESSPPLARCSIDSKVNRVLSKSGLLSHRKVPRDMERLVSDLITEEEKRGGDDCLENGEVLIGKVCRKLECWKEVESNTIDMMSKMDWRNELNGWIKCQEQREEIGMDIENAMFRLLVEELTLELLAEATNNKLITV